MESRSLTFMPLVCAVLLATSQISAAERPSVTLHDMDTAALAAFSPVPENATIDTVIGSFVGGIPGSVFHTRSNATGYFATGEAAAATFVPKINAALHILDLPSDTSCQVLVQGALLPPANFTRREFLQEPKQGPRQPTACPVPASYTSRVNLTVLTKTSWFTSRPWALDITGPANGTYAAAGRGAVSSHAAGSLRISGLQDAKPTDTLQGYAFNVSYIVQSPSQNAFPSRVSLNGTECQVMVNNNLNLPVPEPPAGQASPHLAAAEATPSQPISARNGQLYGVDGQPLTIKGVNWFGFETSVTAVHGLWQGPTALTQDFEYVAWRIALLGFNTIRLPFSFQARTFTVLLNLQAISWMAGCARTSPGALMASVTPPGLTVPSAAQMPGTGWGTESVDSTGTCNANLPDSSVYARFIYLIRYLARQGFYVIVDNHFNVDTLAADNPGLWVSVWSQLLRDIAADPPSAQRTMVDILNEPDSRGLAWQGTIPDMTTLYLQAMDAMHAVSPSTLFLLEGGGQLGLAMNWGDGYVTDSSLIRAAGLSDPNHFFQQLLKKPYLANVVIAPHYYPPSVSTASTKYTGQALWARMSQSFGYLTQAGYGGHVFPLIFGESGSLLQTARARHLPCPRSTRAADLAFYRDFAAYVQNTGAAADGQHAAMPNLVWWDWNPNSGDTGGIVGDDWLTVNWAKIGWLAGTLDLKPWYLQPTGPSPPLKPNPPPPPPPKRAPPPPPPPPPPKFACEVAYSLGYPWTQAGMRMNDLNLAVRNTGSAKLGVPWTLEAYSAGLKACTAAWNWGSPKPVVTSGKASGPVTQDWAVLQPASQNAITVGGDFQSTTGKWDLSKVAVNGVACKVVKQ